VRVFLSYRRTDVGGYAGRLHDDLVSQLGPKNVFQDVAAIPVGQDFTQVIDRQLDDCEAVLAVIGPGWLTASTGAGTPRLQGSDDYVRLELDRALRRGIPVVPVLVGGAHLPAADELPPELTELVRRQSVTLRDETWRADVRGLVQSLRGEPAVPSRHRGRLVAPIAVLAVAASAGVGWWWSTGGGDDDDGGSETELPPCPSPTDEVWTSITLHDDPTGEIEIAEGEDDEGFLEFTVREAHWRPLDTNSWEVILETGMRAEIPNGREHGEWLYDTLVVGDMAFDKTCFSPTPEQVVAYTVGTALVGYETTCEPVGYMELMIEDDADRIGFTQDQESGEC
jgi:hypothetical protein